MDNEKALPESAPLCGTVSPGNSKESAEKTGFEKLKRTGAVAVPSLFTIANMAFGFFAILSASDMEFAKAGWFILAAIVMDMLDGRIARLLKGESSFGVEIDSLSDWISFGIAPSYVMYQFLLKDYGFWGRPVAFIYTLCGALRLARFNTMAHSGAGSKMYFQGLPIPGAAGILASFVVAYTMLESDIPLRGILPIMKQMPVIYGMIPFIMLGLSFLMVSKIPYAAFKQSNLLNIRSLKGMFLVLTVVFLIVAYPQNALFMFFTIYAVSGVVAVLWRAFSSITGPSSSPQ